MFCAPGLHFGVGSCFHMLCSRTLFRRCRGRQVLFSCFALLDSFSAVSRASGPVLMFCAPELVFGCTEGVGSPFHVLRSRTRFLRYRRRRVPFSFFALPYSFSAVLRVSGPVLMFCAPAVFMFCALGLVFDGVECVESRFHVLPSRTRVQRYGGRWVPFSSFARPDPF
jgi:hypothetical protein